MTETQPLTDWQSKLYYTEIPLLKSIQEGLDGQDGLLQMVSKIDDPGLMFVVYFPIIFAINALSGVKFMGAVVLCEWMNLVLKWILHGERPYWWTHKVSLKTSLRQTPMTCETGPGNPSGHVMISIILWFTVYDVLSKLLESGSNSNGGGGPSPLRLVLGRILWNGVLFKICLVIASRTFIAAHFLHQCALAIVFGWFVHKVAYNKVRWLDFHFGTLSFLAASFLITALTVHTYLEDILGFNPNWSIESATKWCQKKEWIYMDTTPFYAMIRFSGAAVGLALSVGCCRFKNLKINRNFLSSTAQKATQLVFGIILGQVSVGIHKNIPKDDMNLFYILEYFLNGTFVFVIIFVVPMLIKSILPNKKRPHSS